MGSLCPDLGRQEPRSDRVRTSLRVLYKRDAGVFSRMADAVRGARAAVSGGVPVPDWPPGAAVRQHLGGSVRHRQASAQSAFRWLQGHVVGDGSSWVGSAARTSEKVGTGPHTTGRHCTAVEGCDAACYCAVSDPEKDRQATRGFSGFQPLLFPFPFAPRFLKSLLYRLTVYWAE